MLCCDMYCSVSHVGLHCTDILCDLLGAVLRCAVLCRALLCSVSLKFSSAPCTVLAERSAVPYSFFFAAVLCTSYLLAVDC